MQVQHERGEYPCQTDETVHVESNGSSPEALSERGESASMPVFPQQVFPGLRPRTLPFQRGWTDRKKERRQKELEKRNDVVKEACVVLHVEKLSAELKTKDWQLDQAREMGEASREKAARLKDREGAEALEKEHLEAQMKTCIQKLLEANEQLQGELLMKEEETEEVSKMWDEEKKKVDLGDIR
ncbi:hypothetical protein MHYP_G00057530 [Metynnis hypsauchen]